MSEIDYSVIPSEIRDNLELYIESGAAPNDLTISLLLKEIDEANKLSSEDISIQDIYDVESFIMTTLPEESFGSKSKIKNWQKSGGLSSRKKGSFFGVFNGSR